MSIIDEILEYNKKFVENKEYKPYSAVKYPNKKIAVLTCMDTRLTELLPAAMNFKNGEVILIKNAGALITHPFGSVMRSLLIAVYELGVEKIMVIGHYNCGMQGIEPSKLIQEMLGRNIDKEKINVINCCGIDIEKWLKGFDDVGESVLKTIDAIKNHPLIPTDVEIYGFVIDPETGKLDMLEIEKSEE